MSFIVAFRLSLSFFSCSLLSMLPFFSSFLLHLSLTRQSPEDFDFPNRGNKKQRPRRHTSLVFSSLIIPKRSKVSAGSTISADYVFFLSQDSFTHLHLFVYDALRVKPCLTMPKPKIHSFLLVPLQSRRCLQYRRLSIPI